MTETLFAQLNAFEWRSSGASPPVQFPCTSMHVELMHDLAEHKFWGVDGARIEATGRAPFVFTASIPFRNGIVPGKSEKWGILYPTAYREFLKATADRATGTLVHPELGELLCKVKQVSTQWDAHRRDGCDVTATWIETLPPDAFEISVSTDSPIGTVELSALDLDASIRTVSPALPELPKYQPDFAATMRSIAAVGDQIALNSQRRAGQVDAVMYRINAIEDSVTRVIAREPTTVAEIVKPDTTARARSALAWPIRLSVTRMRNDLHDVRLRLLADGRPITHYTVPASVTLAGLVPATGAKVADLMALNPHLMSNPVIPAGTVIRLYTSAER